MVDTFGGEVQLLYVDICVDFVFFLGSSSPEFETGDD